MRDRTYADYISARTMQGPEVCRLSSATRANRVAEHRRPAQWVEGRQLISHDRNHKGSDIGDVVEGESVEQRTPNTGRIGTDGDDGGWNEQEECMK